MLSQRASALEAIAQADLILIGPGSLYTSILPNLLVSGVAEAIEASSATRVYISNLMTQPGETDRFSLSDHLRVINKHTRRKLFDWVVASNEPVSLAVARRYRAQGAEPVSIDLPKLQRMDVHCLVDNLIEERGVVRHDAARLSQLLIEKFASGRGKRR